MNSKKLKVLRAFLDFSHLYVLLMLVGMTSAKLCLDKTSYDDRNTQLKKAHIVPSEYAQCTPDCTVTVKYPHYKANYGKPPNATKDQVQYQPHEVCYLPAPKTYYTLLMIDPDNPLPENPTNSPYLHWGICNIEEDNLSKGTELATYQAPAPPTKENHRYIFFIYKQSDKLTKEECKPGRYDMVQTRMNFPFEYIVHDWEVKLSLDAIQFFYCCSQQN